MIEINLLPSTQRKRKKEMRLPPTMFIAIGGGLLLLLFLTTVGLAVGVRMQKGSLRKTKESIAQIKTESEKIAIRKKEEEKLKKRMAIIKKLMDNRILWAKKLNRLSNLVLPRIWLTSLSIEGKSEEEQSGNRETTQKTTKKITNKTTGKFLVIKGVAASTTGETGGLKLVGDFMDKLKNDPSFYGDFTSIQQYGSLRWRQSGGVEAMYFELRCRFKEGR